MKSTKNSSLCLYWMHALPTQLNSRPLELVFSRYWMMESTGSSERTCLQQHHHQQQLQHQQQQQHGTSSGNLLPPGLQSGGVLYTLESQNDFGKVGPGSGVRAAAGDGTHRAATGLKRARDQKNDHSSSGQRELLCRLSLVYLQILVM